MRASKEIDSEERHISGAEGIYSLEEVQRVLKKYLKRALQHPKGFPDKIVLTIEKIKEPIKEVPVLPVFTRFCSTPEEALEFIRNKLSELGVSERAIDSALYVIKHCRMRGATLIDAASGSRFEPDRQRGIRVSRIQMEKKTKGKLLRKIKNLTSDPQRVIEAITIASKVASCREVVAEICISDNPDYTTGYIASKKIGYMRIANIKNYGESYGGRAFFIASYENEFNLERLIKFLEKAPVFVR